RIGLAAVPAGREHRLETREALARHVGEQRLAIAEVAIGRGGRHAGRTRGVSEGEAGRALLLDQLAGGLDQGLAQIAVVISTLAGTPFPAHVKAVYIKQRPGDSNRRVASLGGLWP